VVAAGVTQSGVSKPKSSNRGQRVGHPWPGL
jgi:hypothetical protein